MNNKIDAKEQPRPITNSRKIAMPDNTSRRLSFSGIFVTHFQFREIALALTECEHFHSSHCSSNSWPWQYNYHLNRCSGSSYRLDRIGSSFLFVANFKGKKTGPDKKREKNRGQTKANQRSLHASCKMTALTPIANGEWKNAFVWPHSDFPF